MAEDLEEKVLNKEFSFSLKDLKWVVTTLVAVVLWLVTAVLWFQDREKLDTLSTDNNKLNIEVATLRGEISGVSQASKIFMEHSPVQNSKDIDELKHRVEILEMPGSNPPPAELPTLNDTTTTRRRGH
jgi:hypothetical protein